MAARCGSRFANSKKSPAHWHASIQIAGFEPGIGTTIRAGVQSARGRQRSTTGERSFATPALSQSRRGRVMAVESRCVRRLAYGGVRFKARRGLKLFRRNALGVAGHLRESIPASTGRGLN